MSDSVIAALEAAVAGAPDDVELRAHLAALLVADGQDSAAWDHARAGLAQQPDSTRLLAISVEVGRRTGRDVTGHERILRALGSSSDAPFESDDPDRDGHTDSTDEPVRMPMASGGIPATVDELLERWQHGDAPAEPEIGVFSRPGNSLSDVGGLAEVKHRIERSFLAPMRNPDLQRAFGKAAGGGLVLWGPPGCGKTFLARALAGELSANFYEVGLSEVLDMWVGSSERNLSAVFEFARRNAPCVVFFDELDAIGQKRSNLHGSSGMRTVINQLLSELDGASSDNDGVFFLAATNHPWDLDPALVRPGRFDRKLLVLPPDREARASIFEVHLRDKPVAADIDLARLAKRTDGYTGADIKLICADATDTAMAASSDAGRIVPVSDAMLQQSLRSISPSISAWMQTAKNYATFGNQDGDLDELTAYLKKHL